MDTPFWAAAADPSAVRDVPLATTVLSPVFVVVLARHWLRRRSAPRLLWWAIGILAYGAGTALESAITLAGNTPALTKAWCPESEVM